MRNRVGKTTEVYIIVKPCININTILTGFLAPDTRRNSAHSNSDFCPNFCSLTPLAEITPVVTERTVNACDCMRIHANTLAHLILPVPSVPFPNDESSSINQLLP